MKQDWHGFARRLQLAERTIAATDISENNKKAILDFKRQLVVEGLTPARILTYMHKLRLLALDLDKDFHDCTKDDVMRLVEKREHSGVGEWTKLAYKVVLKRFFKWLRNSEDDYPPEVRWITATIRKDRLAGPGDGDIYTEEEVQALIKAAGHPRDRALVSTLYESGCRIGEIATLRIRDLTFERHGCRLNVVGKTGARPVLVVTSTTYLATWLNMHPDRENRDAPLWVNIGSTKHGKQMQYTGVRKVLQNCHKRARIRKRGNPHLFRHTRASHLAPHLTEYQMNQHFGWKQGSPMASVYVHMSGKNTDAALLRLNGIETAQEAKRPAMEPRKCPRCETLNPVEYLFCGRCGSSFDLKAAMDAEEKTKEITQRRQSSDNLLNELMQDEEVRELLKRKLNVVRS